MWYDPVEGWNFQWEAVPFIQKKFWELINKLEKLFGAHHP